MKSNALVFASSFAAVALAAPAIAHAVPDTLGLTASVTDDGAPLTGSHAFIVSIHDAVTGGTEIWTEASTVDVTDGRAYLTLGGDNPLDANVLDGGPLWVELQVDGTVLEPRLEVTSAAYAIRAGVAEDAERLGGQPASAFATAGHAHTGTYLPVGGSLACTNTQKVSSIDPTTGSVTCSADVDTSVGLAGSGVASTAARSDHNHAGTYLPLAPTGRACTGTQKVTTVNADGTVTCSADVDTNTTYSASYGVLLSGGIFTANFAGTGTAGSVAHSDHDHPEVCPSGYATFAGAPGAGSPLCIKRVTSAVVYSVAATQCFQSHAAGELCTYSQLRIGATATPALALTDDYWMADRVDDNWVLRVNGTNTLDFDESIEIVTTTVLGAGYYCCQRAH